MSLSRSLAPFTLALLLLLLPSAARGEDGIQTSDYCYGEIERSLNRERFLFESVLFGVRTASEERLGAVRVDTNGETWIKTTGGKWVSEGKGPQSNSQMDTNTASDQFASSSSSAPAVRAGLLETQRALTSDLIPSILQSFRAFQCRLHTVCELAEQSISLPMREEEEIGMDPDPLDIQVPGCLEFKQLPSLESCRPTYLTKIDEIGAMRRYCLPAAQRLARYEEHLLLLIAHYDAAHRTLRQFAGYLEPLLDIVRFPFLSPIRQIGEFMNQWNRVPCFLPYCAGETGSSASSSSRPSP